MKSILNRIALWFLGIVTALLIFCQSALYIFYFKLKHADGFFIGNNGKMSKLDVLAKYNAFENLSFAMFTNILTMILLIIIFVFILVTVFNRKKVYYLKDSD